MSEEKDREALDRLRDCCRDFISTGDNEAARGAFNIFDKNHDNRVSKDEVLQVLLRFQGEVGAEEIATTEAVYKASDADSDGTLDFEEFKVFLRELH
jgi:Ca2+-binding EF-hand superfamily protein